MKLIRSISIFVLIAMLSACSQGPHTDPRPKLPSAPAAPPTPTVGNDLQTSEGLAIFNKGATEYFAHTDSRNFEMAGDSEFKRVNVIMAAPASGKCFDALIPFEKIDATSTLAVLTPARIRCEYSGGEELPTATLAGTETRGVFEPFSSTAEMVPGDSPRQTYDMTTDGTTAYWFETASTSLSHDEWRLFAADLRTGRSRLLLKAEDGLGLAGPLPVTSKTNLTIREGRLYFIGYFPTDQYYKKVEAQTVDPEGWEPGDFIQGVLSVKSDGTDLTVAGESIFDFDFTDEHIAYVKFAESNTSFPTPEGTRETTPSSSPRYIAVASSGEDIVAEDSGSSDGTFHTELAIGNFRTSGSSISFTRGLTAYVLNTKTRNVDIVDLTSVIDSAAKNTPVSEAPASITDLIYADGQVALLVKSEGTDEIEHFVVTYSFEDAKGKVYSTQFSPYSLGTERDKFTFRVDVGEIATYSIPNL